jgi:hypothetical protein
VILVHKDLQEETVAPFIREIKVMLAHKEIQVLLVLLVALVLLVL